MTEQMNIFDILNTTKDNEPTYDVNDRVRIKNVKELVKPDAETVAYLIETDRHYQRGTQMQESNLIQGRAS